MSTTSDICIVAVVVGAKYKKFANLFCLDYDNKVPVSQQTEIILVVDSIEGLDVDRYSYVTVQLLPSKAMADISIDSTFGTGTVRNFDYSLKRFGYEAAIDRGYTNILFIDTDMMIRSWNTSVFDRCDQPGLWVGRGYSSAGFGQGFPTTTSDIKFTPKLKALKQELKYDTDWLNYRMPFEAVMYITGIEQPVIQEFIDKWAFISAATKKLRLPMNKVTHEIGLAANMCGIPIHFKKELLSDVFKHYIMNHQVLLDIHSERLNDK